MKVEMLDLSTLKTADRNPKLHASEELKTSVQRFGFVEPIVVDQRTGKMVAGHGRREALVALKEKGEIPEGVQVRDGRWFVPVLTGWSSKNDAEAEAYVVASNRLTERGGWDEKALGAILEDLSKADLLAGTGYGEADVDAILKSLQPPTMEVGRTPDEYLPTFLAGNIKQVVLYFEGGQYEAVLARLKRVMDKEKIANHTNVLLHLLEQYETTYSLPEIVPVVANAPSSSPAP
jgi:hypothetical protein